jgi:hypothetical protein
MIAFPGMLVSSAKDASMSVPPDVDDWDNRKEQFPHFWAFCMMQLGAPMPYPGVAFDNAKVIADIPLEALMTLSVNQIVERGFNIGYPIP